MNTHGYNPFTVEPLPSAAPVSLTETTIPLPVIPVTGPMPRDPYMQPETDRGSIAAMLRDRDNDRYDTARVSSNNKPPIIPGWMKLAGAVALTAAVTAGISYFEKPADQVSSVQQQEVLPSPSFITTPSESAGIPVVIPDMSSPSASVSTETTPSTSTSSSPVASTSPAKISTPKPTKSVVVVASPTPTRSVPVVMPSTSPSSANVCSWPMNSQGDSEVRDTCANGAAMEAYNSADKNSGESFAIYPGLYVHDIAKVGAYTEVSIGGGNNVTVGYVPSNLIGNPYGQ